MKIKSVLKNSFYALKIVFKYAPWVAGIYALFSLVGSLFTVLQVLFLQHLVDSVIAYAADSAINDVILWGTLYISSLFLSQIYTFSLGKMGRFLNRRLTKALSPAIINKFGRIEYHYFENKEFRDIMSRMTANPQQMIHNTFFSVMSCVNSILKLAGILGVFFAASPWIGSGALIIGLPMTILEISSTDKKQILQKENTFDKRKESYIQDLFSNKYSAYEINVFGAQNYLLSLWTNICDKIMRRQKEITISFIKSRSVVIFLKITYVSFTIVLLAFYLVSARITFGVFVSIISSIGNLFSILNTASYLISALGTRTHEIGYYRDFTEFAERSQISDKMDIDKYDIVFENVHFTYPGTDKEILSGVSFTINDGERAALVGVNGAGKSTIIKLLCGLYKPDSGKIFVGGRDLNDFSDTEINRFCAVVFQDFCSYELSLRENVAIGNLDSFEDDQRILSALNMSGATDVIKLGLEANLGHLTDDGIDLSKGQWQRVAIARALISNAAFIILDEPTASLDPVAESRMYELFSSVIQKRGSIVISHRLASSKLADKIIVIDNGKITEIGSHDELMKQNGLYSKMFEEQREWYINSEAVG
ncbi:MAG: ABC transporter ATP-binding protein [Eubacteriales bacterium]|jgi:ATP-binding cassette subfamily B protein